MFVLKLIHNSLQTITVYFCVDLSEDEIRRKLAVGGIERRKRQELGKKRIKSTVWEKLFILFDLSSNKIVSNYVLCGDCNNLLKYNAVSCSTTSLQRHICQTPITAYYKSKNLDKIKIATADVKSVREAVVKLISKDLRPIVSIEGEGRL